ncbi:RNA-dependent RNA polymerase [Beihai narna-like virus 4]|uniref:RNA-dependent RNA polymerase n=1 Tax=Beihai narna-like virus 4 TaxID=1922456 RepID=UPI00090CB081|nr:RNA-dependent RNA polymerase [Beihai narna-like virus 4]APG77088.1 RNA-dependent RNA polymerase [Beihai narna-like virus 4]
MPVLSTLRIACVGYDPTKEYLEQALAERTARMAGDIPCASDVDESSDGPGVCADAYLHGIRQMDRVEEVWSHIYRCYEIDPTPFSERDRGLFLWLGAHDQLESYLKWRTAWLLAQVWEQRELPSKPGYLSEVPNCYRPPRVGLTWGDSAFWQRAIHQSGNIPLRLQECAYALYQGKAGALPMRPDLVDAKVEEAMSRLTTPCRTRSQVIGGRKVTLQDLKEQVTRTVKEIYGPSMEEEVPTPGSHRLGSTKSSFQCPRGGGGAHQALVEEAGEGRAGVLGLPQLVGYTRERDPVPVYSTTDHLEWSHTVEASKVLSFGETMACYPVGLVEPFKVRVITRGAAHHYHLARRWQPSMWRPLAAHPTFQLVGRPCGRDVMYDLVRKVDFGDGRLWMSGDYQAATDYFDPELSGHCLMEVCDSLGVPWEDRIVLRRALIGHVFHDPDTHEYLGHQARGQLMGSPVSFPILCLLNAALTRFAFELAGREASMLRDQPILVNGDDLLCRTSDKEYYIWSQITAMGGLIPSLGKCFRHRRIATINSEMWVCRKMRTTLLGPLDGPLSEFTYTTIERRHLPLEGLARGSIKGASGTTDSQRRIEKMSLLDSSNVRSLVPMGDCWREYVRSTPSYADESSPGVRAALQRRLWDHCWDVNRDRLKRISRFPISFCMPVRYGGLGFPLPPPSSRSYAQRLPKANNWAMANLLANRPNLRRALLSQLKPDVPCYGDVAYPLRCVPNRDANLDEEYDSFRRSYPDLPPESFAPRRGLPSRPSTDPSFWGMCGSEPTQYYEDDSGFLRIWNAANRIAQSKNSSGKYRWAPLRRLSLLDTIALSDHKLTGLDLPHSDIRSPFRDTGVSRHEVAALGDVVLNELW